MQHGIASVLGWSQLRPVQDLTIDAVLEGQNAIVLAPTAGGKTEAAFFPILDQLHRASPKGVGCVYVSPLRALLNNQDVRVERLAKLVGLKVFKWHGDVGASPRNRFLAEPTEILMTTPESLEVLLMSGRAAEHRLFDGLSYVVIDEVHAFAAGERGAHLMSLLERIKRRWDLDFQRIGLSATVGDPEGLARWMQGSSGRSWTIVDPPRERRRRRIAVRHVGGELEESAAAAVPLARGRKSIFFTQGRADTERVREVFHRSGLPVYVHHSSVSREFREEAETHFAQGSGPAALVSTSTLELGIDVGDLDVVLQLDAPTTVSSFLQRMGRTGRRPGADPHLEFFTSDANKLLQAIALVSLASRGFVERISPSTADTPVFLHQLLAQVVEHSSIGRRELWKSLRGPVPFMDVEQRMFDRIVDHLLETGVLRFSDGLLSLGEQGERAFGARHFFDLYAVFETPPQVTVKTPEGRRIGTLELSFVHLKEGEGLVFLLAGRSWKATEVHLDRGLMIAVPVSGGEPPRWHGAGGFLSREVAEEMRRILLSDEEPGFIDEAGLVELRRLRDELGPVLEVDRCPLVGTGSGLLLYTFAGGRVNATIAALLEQSGVARVRGFGDLEVDLGRPKDGMLDVEVVRTTLQDLGEVDARLNEADKAALVMEKSRGKLTKFQPYLPPELEGAYLAERLFDLNGVAHLARVADFALASTGKVLRD